MRRILSVVVIVFTAIVAIAFATLNSESAHVDLLVGDYTLPLSVIIVLSMLAGLILGAVVAGLVGLRRRAELRGLRHRLAAANEELESLRKLPIKDGW